MKRGSIDHPKMLRLAKLLGIARWGAVGLLESLIHFVAKHAIQGNVGRWSDEEISYAVAWDSDPATLVDALVKAGFLERHPTHRLIVHDWHKHADDSVRKTLKNNNMWFVTMPEESRTIPENSGNGSPKPSLSSPSPEPEPIPPPPPPKPAPVPTKAEEEEEVFDPESLARWRWEAERLGLADLDAVNEAMLHCWTDDDFAAVFRRFAAEKDQWATVKSPLGMLASWLREKTPEGIPWPNAKSNGTPYVARKPTGAEAEERTVQSVVRELRSAKFDFTKPENRSVFLNKLLASGLTPERAEHFGKQFF